MANNISSISRVSTIIAIASGLFIVGMFFIFFRPLAIQGTPDEGIETLYDKNEGLIWFIGIVIGVGIVVQGYINGVYQRDLTKCTKENLAKNKIIEEQNKNILSNQLEYIKQIKQLGADLNTNFEKDNKTKEQMIGVLSDVSKFGERLSKAELSIKKWNRVHSELRSLNILTQQHEEEIRENTKNIETLNGKKAAKG